MGREGGDAERHVVQHFDQHPSEAEHDDGPEEVVLRDADHGLHPRTIWATSTPSTFALGAAFLAVAARRL